VKNDNTHPTPPGSGIFHVTPVDDKQHAQQQVTDLSFYFTIERSLTTALNHLSEVSSTLA